VRDPISPYHPSNEREPFQLRMSTLHTLHSSADCSEILKYSCQAAPITGAVLLLSGMWYLLSAHKHYKGPMDCPAPVMIRHHDGDAEALRESRNRTPSDQKDTKKEGLPGSGELVKEV
jgi:hypothetical protein